MGNHRRFVRRCISEFALNMFLNMHIHIKLSKKIVFFLRNLWISPNMLFIFVFVYNTGAMVEDNIRWIRLWREMVATMTTMSQVADNLLDVASNLQSRPSSSHSRLSQASQTYDTREPKVSKAYRYVRHGEVYLFSFAIHMLSTN